MTETILTATVRTGTGKGVMRKLRRAGKVPGVVYGLGTPQSIQCDALEAGKLVHALHGSERLISLELSDGQGGTAQKKAVLLKDAQMTPVGARLLHLDLYEVDVSQTVQVSVGIHPEGRPEGEIMGGILQQVTHEVTIECLPTAIPDFLPVDVTSMEIGHSLHLSDVPLPEGITLVTTPEETLFVMAAPRVEEEPEAVDEEGIEMGEDVPTTAEGEEGEDSASEE